MQLVAKKRTRHITLVLEDIYQAHNAAAVVRSAEAFGIQDIYAIEAHYPLKIKQSTVSRGAYKWLDFHRYQATEPCLRDLKSKDYKIAVTALGQESTKLQELPINQPVAIVLGTEMTGVSQEAIDMADYLLEVPMAGFTQSFNLSVCGAIVLHYLTEKMKTQGLNWQLPPKEQDALLLEWLKRSIPHHQAYL